MANAFEVGQIDWFDDVKGFGFIKRTSREDVFVHTSNAPAGVLKAGAWVVFERAVSKKGPFASKVQGLGDDHSVTVSLFPALTPLSTEAIFMLKDEEVTKKLLLWQVANLGSSSPEPRFEKAAAIRKSCSKHLPNLVEGLSQSVLPLLAPSEQWYWWKDYCPPATITRDVIEYFEKVADIHYADPANTFSWLQVDDGDVGSVFMHSLTAAHFHILFQALWPHQRAVESLATNGGELIKTRWYQGDDGWFINAQYRLSSKRGFMLRHFAELAVEGVAELLWQHRRVVVPGRRFLEENWNLFEEEHFWELLHHDLPEINELALNGYVSKLGPIITEQAYKQAVALLEICAASVDAELLSQAIELVEATASGPIKIKLWLGGFLPGLDVADVLEECPFEELETYLEGPELSLRGPAAQVLLNRAAGIGGAVGIRAGLKVLFAVNHSVADEVFQPLLFIYPEASDVWLAIRQWTGEQGPQPEFSVLCHWLLMQDEQVDGEPLAILDLLADEEQVRFLYYVLEVDPQRLMRLSTGLLLKWFERLPAEDKQVLIKLIVRSRRKELALELWLADLTDFYSFADYYLHIAMLAPEAQFLFLRKTFGLMAAGKVALTVEELDAIPRHSMEDENPFNRRLDYSIDLVLKVLLKLKNTGEYPEGTEVINCIRDYAGNSIKQLLQFSTLFEPCPGRTVLWPCGYKEKYFARIGSKLYPATADLKCIFANNQEFQVVNGSIDYKGKLYPVKWELGKERVYDEKLVDHGDKASPTCCEGQKALATDKITGEAFWWCYGLPCHGANQKNRIDAEWKFYTLRDFIRISGLQFCEEPYYRLIGVINRVNELLKRLYCKKCGVMLQPCESSDFNFFRDTRFTCAEDRCQEQGRIVYLSRCMNPRCAAVIDSRVSKKCNYEGKGHDWKGLYICERCGSCCSQHKLDRKITNLKAILGLDAGPNVKFDIEADPKKRERVEEQLRGLQRQRRIGLFHAENHEVFCYNCCAPMIQDDEQDGTYRMRDYRCLNCDKGVIYAQSIAYVEVCASKEKGQPVAPLDEDFMN